MSVGRQFKRIGETTVAYRLWGLIIWLISNPLRLFLALILVFIGIKSMSDESGEKYYINVKELKLFDKPFGKNVKTLRMNDSLIVVSELSDGWKRIAIKNDTLFFNDNYSNEDRLINFDKKQKTKFNKFKALIGQKAKLNHPKGFYDNGSDIIKNGETIEIVNYSDYDSLIEYRFNYTRNKIKIKYLQIEWKAIFKKYPEIAE